MMRKGKTVFCVREETYEKVKERIKAKETICVK
jgi:hypothetical protein